jgi:hypothetical protein
MAMYPAREGVLGIWQLTDAAGNAHTFVAQLTSSGKPRAVYRALFDGGQVFVGEDQNVYGQTETRDFEANTDTIAVQRWDFQRHRFIDQYAPFTVELNAAAPSQVIDAQVSWQRVLYVAYIEQPDSSDCAVESWPCSQAVAPTQVAPIWFVRRIGLTGAQGNAPLPALAATREPRGRNVLEWWQGGTGFDSFTFAFGGVRMAVAFGHEDIASDGTVIVQPSFVEELTDPLRFGPAPAS